MSKSNKPSTSSVARPPPVQPKPPKLPPIVHQGKVGGPGSDTSQQKGWKDVGKF